jgi:hypothetical protein
MLLSSRRSVKVLSARNDSFKASYSVTGSKAEIEAALSQVRDGLTDVQEAVAR